MSKPSKLAPYKAGSKRSLLSARNANELVSRLNALAELSIVPGAADTVTWSAGNVVITRKSLLNEDGETGFGWRFANPREYDAGTTYSEHEVVVTEEGDLDAGEFAGLWVSLVAANTGHTPVFPASDWWYFIGFTPILVDTPVTVDSVINCTDYQAWVQMSSPFLK